jgi:hypothetical protein
MEKSTPAQTPQLTNEAQGELNKQAILTKKNVDMARFVFTILNFGVTVVLTFVLLGNAFNMGTITSSQVFVADRMLQSFTDVPPNEMDSFIKKAYGTETRILHMIDEITVLPLLLPKMYEISGSDSILLLSTVHCNFMLFSALWIASAFSLAMIQLPDTNMEQWGTARVLIVHVWNLIGLVFTIVLFSSTTKWGSIPVSNLFYALIGQVMAWMYQYFHMVECTQKLVASLSIKPRGEELRDATKETSDLGEIRNNSKFTVYVSTEFSTEFRKIIYMQFSVVSPMLLVSGMIAGANGVDEWRIQTVLFSSWTIFALLGLHLRYRRSLNPENGGKDILHDDEINRGGLDALGYLSYALIMVYIMLLNAMGSATLEDDTFTTTRTRQARWGVRTMVFVIGFLVLETMAVTLKIRFWPYNGKADESQTKNLDKWMIPPFIANILIIAFGSLLVNILIFAGLSDVNGLSTFTS